MHAWETIFTYRLSPRVLEENAIRYLKHVFQKLLLNFTWWMNRKDRHGNNIIVLLGICFVAGLAARTGIGTHVNRQIEQLVLRRVPGFTFFKTIAQGIAGLQVESELAVALARIEDAWVLSFVVERHASGLFTVFVPSAPTPAAGSIYYLTADRLRMLNVPVSTAMACIMRLGVGSRDLLDSQQQLAVELTHNQVQQGEQPT